MRNSDFQIKHSIKIAFTSTHIQMALRLGLHFSLLLLAISAVDVARAEFDKEFPEWDLVRWVVKSTDVITLRCRHDKYYPFNDTSSMQNVQWILPEGTSYLHVKAGATSEGWNVSSRTDNYTLTIDKSKLNVPSSADGMYVCAALAKVYHWIPNNNTYAWYYLRWGVGLYTNVPAMNDGSIAKKYYWCFTYAWVTELVFITILVLFAVAIQFHYKGGPDMSESDDAESDSYSISPTSNEKISSSIKKDGSLEIDVEDVSGKIL